MFEHPRNRIHAYPSLGNIGVRRRLLKQIEAQIEARTPEPETQIPAQELASGEGNRYRAKV